MASDSLTVVIPAKNEEGTIGSVIKETQKNAEDYFSEIKFIVSSSSNDSTDDIARDLGAEVIRDGGRGLGEAMFRGLKKAVEFDTEYILTIDSDHQFQPSEVHRLIENREKADLILGSRFLEDGVDYKMSLSHQIGNKILTDSTNHVTGLDLTDAQTGYRLMTREVAEELRMVGKHTYVQETLIDAHQNGFTMHEVPVTFAERESGGSKVVSSISEYAIRTLPVILHRSKLSAYMLNGLSIAGLLISLGILISSIFLEDMILGAVGFLTLLVSLQALFFGMFIDGELP